MTPDVLSLSALTPIKFSYKFNREERMDSTLNSYDNGFRFYTHKAFSQFRDASLSKKNCLILTDNVSLRNVFASDSTQIDVGTVAGSFYLKTSEGTYFTRKRDELFVGGIGEKLLLTIIPIQQNYVEIVTENFKKLTIDEDYPYTARLSNDVLNEDKLHRQRFEMDYANNLISFKVKVKEGYRFLSYGVDKIVRATGLMLNDTVCNNYLLTPEWITDSGLYYGFDAKTTEVKYFNQIPTFINQNTVTVKDETDVNTHLLITCATETIAQSATVPINIALMKSNFSSAGTYLNTEN